MGEIILRDLILKTRKYFLNETGIFKIKSSRNSGAFYDKFNLAKFYFLPASAGF